ncbi:hypothetical protein [Curtobacterium sp. MCSS17_016]|uniref:hypothetical protein n=1 Tax=Curtobacterium sp. MCSS17_016 TaxID=2175644 RepID=UPI000DAA4DBF|nr:hypothetical protein [Curtobacterium sp. MCSS17_016]WIE80834.1 hypothetical protein DEJ19_020170 [Curtobacterium sp. MCSS17_016]
MSVIDSSGNLHGQNGRFTEKNNTEATVSLDAFRDVPAGPRTLRVQTTPVSEGYALANADKDGMYTAVLSVDRYFYAEAVDAGDGVDTLTDDLAARLVSDLSPYSLSEKIVGYDYDRDEVLLEVSMDVVASAAEKIADEGDFDDDGNWNGE